MFRAIYLTMLTSETQYNSNRKRHTQTGCINKDVFYEMFRSRKNHSSELCLDRTAWKENRSHHE